MARTESFVPDGRRVFASAAQIVAVWRRHTQRIPAQFALGTAQHESGFTLNEVDTEASGYVSKGIFQISGQEAADAGLAQADLLSLEDATAVFSILCERRLQSLIAVAHLDERDLPADVWAYLALAHNQGLAAAHKTIRAHGLDWAAYKQRNPQLVGMGRYGDDVISGGARWAEVTRDAPSVDAPLQAA